MGKTGKKEAWYYRQGKDDLFLSKGKQRNLKPQNKQKIVQENNGINKK